MINGYIIKKENGKDVLYLSFDFSYEFGKFNKSDKKTIKEQIKEFLVKNHIIFTGAIVLTSFGNIIGRTDTSLLKDNVKLIDNSIIEKISNTNFYGNNSEEILNVATLDTTLNEEQIENNDVKSDDVTSNTSDTNKNTNTKNINTSTTSKVVKSDVKSEVKEEKKQTEIKEEQVQTEIKEEKNDISTNEKENIDSIYVTVHGKNGVTVIELEEYVVGVVAGEMPASFNSESLKSLSVLARTYALKSLKYGKTLTDDVRTQTYKTVNDMKSMWGSDFDKYYNKIKNAVSSTKGEYLWYGNDYIEAVYHSTSNGKTENSSEVWGTYYPYLISVDSIYDNINKSFESTKVMSYSELSNILKMDVNIDTEFNILSKTEGNRVKEIKINDNIYTGVELRNLLALRSADFTIEKNESGISINTTGYGHGVGLSEWGAEGLARNGYNYIDILKHYYTGTVLKKL